jgi:hypothetical protein
MNLRSKYLQEIIKFTSKTLNWNFKCMFDAVWYQFFTSVLHPLFCVKGQVSFGNNYFVFVDFWVCYTGLIPDFCTRVILVLISFGLVFIVLLKLISITLMFRLI